MVSLTIEVTTPTVTEDEPSVIVSFPLRIGPAPVSVGLADASVPLSLPAVAVAPDLLTSDTADVEVAEPQVRERPGLPTQDARFTKDDILQTE